MSDIFRDRHAKLGCMVLRLFPKVMQMLLRYYVTPPWLKQKYLKQHFSFVLTENEIVLMDKLPNMDEFTIEICYKILRFENMLDEPKCKWGNVPHDAEEKIADDIQRLINATNSIIKIKFEEVTEQYAEKLLEEIKSMITRIDSYLEQDTLGSMYNNLCGSETVCISILQDLTRVKPIDMAEYLTNTESEKRERYSRLSIPIIEIFPNILRNVISTKISPELLYQKCVPVLNSFYPEQQTIIKGLQNLNPYGSLDVTLIYQLLRQFSLIPSPTKGWGSFPDKDKNVGDDVERIRFYRNKLVHRSDTKIEKNEFDEYFNEFRGIGYRMDQYFSRTTHYEQQIICNRTCAMDTAMQAKYENAMKQIENIKLRYEKKPIKVYWGESFDRSLMNLRSLLKEEKLEGNKKVRVQIVFQNEAECEKNIEILNLLKAEINEGLIGIELIVATRGSVVLNIDILLGIMETDKKFQTTLVLFLEKILERIAFTTETIDIVLLPVEEMIECNKSQTMGEQVYLEFDIEAKLLETDDKMVEKLRNISDAIFKHSNRIGTNQNSTATLLHINLDMSSERKTEEGSPSTNSQGEGLPQEQTHLTGKDGDEGHDLPSGPPEGGTDQGSLGHLVEETGLPSGEDEKQDSPGQGSKEGDTSPKRGWAERDMSSERKTEEGSPSTYSQGEGLPQEQTHLTGKDGDEGHDLPSGPPEGGTEQGSLGHSVEETGLPSGEEEKQYSPGQGSEGDNSPKRGWAERENIPTTTAAFIQAQTPVKYNLPVSVNLRKQLNIKKSENEYPTITSCIKIGNALVFTDCFSKRLIICNVDGTDIHHISLSGEPCYITDIDSNTVAVSCTLIKTILIINLCTRSVTSTINTSVDCSGISYNDNNLYVVIDHNTIHVMDLTGKVIRTISSPLPFPSDRILDITVDRDRMVCIDARSIYCCSLDGKLMWTFKKKDQIQDLHCVTTDDEGHVYLTDNVVSHDGTHYTEIVTKSDGLDEPWGIHFDKKENILLVCNWSDGNAFLFDVKKKLT